MSEIIAYASSTRPNHLWSAAQFNSALPKNRADADIPLVSKADLDSLVEERDRLREALQKAETVIDLMADVVTYDATMQGPKILGVNGSAARRASEAARDYLIAKDRLKP
jgi:hypothetical protein